MKIVNSGMVAAKNVSVSVKVEFPDSTTEYKRDQVMVIPAHGWRECFIPSRIVLKEGDLSRLERDEMILRVSGRVTRDNETIEYCYKYNGWQFGDRPAKLPRFVTCDFDTQVAMSAIARIAAGASVTASAGTPTIRAENPEQTPKEPTEPN